MTVKIECVKTSEKISLEISGFSQAQTEAIEARVLEILKVVQEIIKFDSIYDELPYDETSNRQIACQAVNLKYQIALETAKTLATLCRDVAEGSEKIEDHGFPEFSDE
jgi:hypothetical protein